MLAEHFLFNKQGSMEYFTGRREIQNGDDEVLLWDKKMDRYNEKNRLELYGKTPRQL